MRICGARSAEWQCPIAPRMETLGERPARIPTVGGFFSTPTGRLRNRSCRNSKPRQEPHLSNPPDSQDREERHEVVH